MSILSKLLSAAYCCMALSGYAQNATEAEQTNSTAEGSCCAKGCLCANDQAPAGIMTASIHEKGRWMAGYMYMNMDMRGSRIGANSASNADVYQHYLMAPEKMTMQMHMAMLMYGVTDKLTLMATGGYATSDMSMRTYEQLSCCPPGSNLMQSSSAGLLDTRIYGLYSLVNKNKSELIGGLGVSLPTGENNANGVTMLGSNKRESYCMQPGSGSFALLPSVTYIYKAGQLSAGGVASADVKLNDNNNCYRFGNAYEVSAWVSRRLLPFMSGSIRVAVDEIGKVKGYDKMVEIPYNLQGDPTTNTGNTGGAFVSAYAGINVHFDKPVLDRFKLQAEYGMPMYQNVNGTQMGQHSSLVAGLYYSF